MSEYNRRQVLLLICAAIVAGAAACRPVTGATPTPPASTPTPTETFSQYQLVYRLLENYPDYFWCDPDFFPIGREGQEEQNSIEQFPAIRANAPEFAAILEQLKLPDKADYSAGEKLSIYREHKKLTRIVEMTAAPGGYAFSLRTGEDQGLRIEGAISFAGRIAESKREASFNTCPICLTRGTFIDTPDGQVPVERLSKGMQVWTLDESGGRVAAPVIATVATPVPPGFEVVEITLSDGRTVTASPGHPTADWRPLGSYQAGDTLDGAFVTSAVRHLYNEGATYDLLPAGPTGLYWANGVLLKSTLVGR